MMLRVAVSEEMWVLRQHVRAEVKRGKPRDAAGPAIPLESLGERWSLLLAIFARECKSGCRVHWIMHHSKHMNAGLLECLFICPWPCLPARSVCRRLHVVRVA